MGAVQDTARLLLCEPFGVHKQFGFKDLFRKKGEMLQWITEKNYTGGAKGSSARGSHLH